MKRHSKNASFNPVQTSAGFSSALQKILQVLKAPAMIVLCSTIALTPFVAEGRKTARMKKAKALGQIFTPDYLVREILDIAGYTSTNSILKKHIIDNSCGNGAFLVEAVKRYCSAAHTIKHAGESLKMELETYVHGIELDEQAYRSCLTNLDSIATSFSLPKIAWDVRLANALDVDAYDGKMDFVVGNPPYVRVHNLEDSYNRVKMYRFCTGGMTDLYLVFYEIGLGMLKNGGRLCYIAPSSWLNSLAGESMRNFVRESRWLREIIDLGHYQPFNATTYTAITLFEKTPRACFSYKTYKGPGKIFNIAILDFDTCYFDNALYLGDRQTIASCRKIKTGNFPDYVDVKNGFATLADNVFIADKFPFDDMVIPVVKASTGKWRKAFYPYDKKGKPFSYDEIFQNASRAKYLQAHKTHLLKGRDKSHAENWYLYGRTQALKDVWMNKYAINTVVKDVASIKFNKVRAGEGVYSGLYILSKVPEAHIRAALLSDDFINYIRVLKKYKSGGYYTFSSKDVKQFLNFQLDKILGGKEKRQGRLEQHLLDL